MKLNLGCGTDRMDGYHNVDIRDDIPVDQAVDLTGRWPWDDDSVDEIVAKMLLPYLSMPERIHFMEEAWRVLKPAGTMQIIVPGRGSNQAIADPYYLWPEICEEWFHNFSKEGRALRGVSHYPIKADFHWGYAHGLSEYWAPRTAEAQQFAIWHHRDAVQFVHVNLKKIADNPEQPEPVLEPEVAAVLMGDGWVDPSCS